MRPFRAPLLLQVRVLTPGSFNGSAPFFNHHQPFPSRSFYALVGRLDVPGDQMEDHPSAAPATRRSAVGRSPWPPVPILTSLLRMVDYAERGRGSGATLPST